ncbi:hypothetical protein ACFU76_08035 [Streptomyces sp. NPDC057539]|uniref:hypothetical protein n=1 Tax=Streptomyces sp. NPDC057539 TaxID=3346159 RepID=UPI003679933D
MTAIGIPPRTPQDWDVPAADVEAQMTRLRESLPLTDPDRHDLDTTADAAFARLAANWGGAS